MPTEPVAIIIARLPAAPVGVTPWVLLAGPDIPPATVRRTWARIASAPPAQYLECQLHVFPAPCAVAYSAANPALADRDAYLDEIAAQIPAAEVIAKDTLAALRAAESDLDADPNDHVAHTAKRAADSRAHAAGQALRRLQSELHRRHRVLSGLEPLDRQLDGTTTPPAVPRILPAPEPAADPEPAAPSSAKPQKKAAKKPAPAPEAPPSDGVSG